MKDVARRTQVNASTCLIAVLLMGATTPGPALGQTQANGYPTPIGLDMVRQTDINAYTAKDLQLDCWRSIAEHSSDPGAYTADTLRLLLDSKTKCTVRADAVVMALSLSASDPKRGWECLQSARKDTTRQFQIKVYQATVVLGEEALRSSPAETAILAAVTAAYPACKP